MLEKPTTCKSGVPTLNGSRSSTIRMNTSSISETRRHLMYTEERMKKEERSLPGKSTMERTRGGKLSILIRPRSKRLQANLKSLVS